MAPLGLVHADGGMGSWQGSGATSALNIQYVVAASGVRTRPLKQARDWGYQRMVANRVVLLADAAPQDPARAAAWRRLPRATPVTRTPSIWP